MDSEDQDRESIEPAFVLPPQSILQYHAHVIHSGNQEELDRMTKFIQRWYQTHTPTLFLCKIRKGAADAET